MARFGSVVTAMITPFHSDGALDVDGAVVLARHLVSGGSDGLLVAGTVAVTEFPRVTMAVEVAVMSQKLCPRSCAKLNETPLPRATVRPVVMRMALAVFSAAPVTTVNVFVPAFQLPNVMSVARSTTGEPSALFCAAAAVALVIA